MKKFKFFTLLLSLVFFTISCRANSDWALIFIRKGKVYMKQEDYMRALIEFQKAIRMNPKNENAYLGAADAYLALGNCEVAVENINEASVHNPNIDAEYYFKKGECLAQRQNPPNLDAAIREGYSRAISQDSRRAHFYYRRGLAYRGMGEEELALKDLEMAQMLGHSSQG